MSKQNNLTAPIIACARHRMQSDGKGITTLVLFHGCPLRCRWCVNSFSLSCDTKTYHLTPQELYDKISIDNLYFLATGGGVTFGGGEPLLYPDYIAEFTKACPKEWNICVETSLSVPWENIEKVACCVDMFYIDCKDVDPEIYYNYTGKSNELFLENIKKLLQIVPSEKITVRIPLIPQFNTTENQQNSRAYFENLGITQFDLFDYFIPDEENSQ